MRPLTTTRVETWWREVFGIDGGLWSSVSVQHPHGYLGDYPGWYVAWRGRGVHVSAPAAASGEDVAAVAHDDVPSLQRPVFWREFARERRLDLIGPSTHAYLDDDPGPLAGVAELSLADLEGLRTRVPPHEWDESGMTHDPAAARLFGLVEDGRPVAVAVLNRWAGRACDVGVLVDPAARGRGLAGLVTGQAASVAVREHGIARWRSATANVASARVALRLGFRPYATQLAIRRASTLGHSGAGQT